MSLKIHGNLSPAVGKEEKYTIKEPFEGFNIFPPPIQPIDHKVKWYVYVLENGKWRKTKENDKTGETVSYTFTQKSLSRKGIKIEVQRGFETASEVIKPQRAEEQKILKVELLDAQENKLTKPLSYGQTVVAKATCTGLEYQMVSLTLWEDDAKGAGHSPINQKNRATTKTVEVKRGIAKTSFKLMPSFDKMAKAFQTAGGEGKLHEYYVTASIQDTLSASNNIDVKALEEPVPPVKKKVPVIDPKKPRPNVPKPSTSTKPSVKKEITDVKLFKTSETTLKAHVYYNGLQGKKIRFKLMEDDGGALFNDENQVFDLPKNSDCLYIDIALKKVSKSKGDDMLEGWEQELFVDIEVIETASHHKTATLNVNNSGFGTDPVDDTNKVVKVGEEKKESKDCGEKYCIKKGSPNSELIREINIRLAGFGGNVPTDEFTDRTEKMIKQFQRDYMKVPETGKVCGNVLKAIDEFSTKYNFTFDQVKCKCGTCTGFGDSSNKGLYLKNLKDEGHHRYEYPGLHRSLLSSVRAVIFYLAKDGRFSLNKINSGYRCRFHEEYLKKPTTNHMGKALDLHFNDSKGKRTRTTADMNTIRKDVFNKYLGAKWDWKEGNIFNLESEDVGALTWVHYDVREFSKIYHDDKYFVKTLADLNGKSIVSLANELGFEKTCICFGGGNKSEPNVNKPVVAGSCEDKFKKVAPIILKHEGGYVNDPDDSGGETNKGITIGTFKQYAKEDLGIEPTSENLKKITDDQATIIYRKRYWEPKGFCKIEDDKVSLMIYDWTITSGGAAKKVQELLIDEFDKKITADGGIGSKTIEAINSVEDQDKLLKRIGAIRKEYYTNLAIKDGKHTKNYKFLDGWHNRVDDCLNIKL